MREHHQRHHQRRRRKGCGIQSVGTHDPPHRQGIGEKEIGFEYLHGGVPSEKRKNLVDNFMNEPSSRVFLSTDAGSTGLNLQSAATIINIDLPWNPAVLEQRIGRIYRLGQQNNIQVINLVTPYSIEEEMLGKLRFKTSMFEGVLDDGEDSVSSQMISSAR